MTKYPVLASLIVMSVLSISAIASPFVASSFAGPMVRTSEGNSLNWSGYAVSIPDVTWVSASFAVPTVSAPGSVNGLSTDVSVWVGIDGYTSGTVEQTGVSGSYSSTTGTASYYAWWEMYPRVSTTIRTMSVSAGDQISASVNYIGGGQFTLSLTDKTSGHSFSTTTNAPVGGRDVAQRNSAEWVVERAATIYRGYLAILPLATFSGVTFTSESFTAGGVTNTLQYAVNNYAQYSGYPTTPPSQPYWENMYIVGFDSNGAPYPLDSTSSVNSNSCSVSLIANGAPIEIPGIYRH